MPITPALLIEALKTGCSENAWAYLTDGEDAGIDGWFDLAKVAEMLNIVTSGTLDAEALRKDLDRIKATVAAERLARARVDQERAQAFRDAEWQKYFSHLPPYE